MYSDFIKEAEKATNVTLSNEGSLKYTTSGDEFINNFCSIARFREPRPYVDIAKDMYLLWSIDPKLCVKLALYIRLVSRKSHIFNEDTKEIQKGQGLKHEGIHRFLWLAYNHPTTFKMNIWLIIAAGSWKDVFEMMRIDLQNNGWKNRQLDWEFFESLINVGLVNNSTTHLVRKYFPTIQSHPTTPEAIARTAIGKWIAKKLVKIDSYKNYRIMKSHGIAHEWQQFISKQLYDKIKFDNIAGRALNLLVNSKFLDNHNLRDKYTEWIKNKPVAKYTGFVFELFKPLDPEYNFMDIKYPEIDEATKLTINAQFNTLLKDANIQSKLLVARDISSSMLAKAKGCNMTSYSIAKALSLYFSEFLTGPFANSYIEFATECRLVKWKGNTPVDKWLNDSNNRFGSTNFFNISKLFVQLKEKGIAESDFPEGILAISDGEFTDPIESNLTNFQAFRIALKTAGFSEEYLNKFKLILWDIPNNFYGKTDTVFEEFADAPNCYHMSGYDPCIISFLLGDGFNPCNSKELFENCMNQELLNKVIIELN